MKIYTKTGDEGSTGLIGGKRVSKSDLRIEAYGTIDELNSYIGLLASYTINQPLKPQLQEIQDRLFTTGALLATDTEGHSLKIPSLTESDIQSLEKGIDEMDAVLAPLSYFILPGGHKEVAFAHIGRCVCRRAERTVVSLAGRESIDALIIKYLNRLSDYLFTLCRWMTLQLNAEEVRWVPRHDSN